VYGNIVVPMRVLKTKAGCGREYPGMDFLTWPLASAISCVRVEGIVYCFQYPL